MLMIHLLSTKVASIAAIAKDWAQMGSSLASLETLSRDGSPAGQSLFRILNEILAMEILPKIDASEFNEKSWIEFSFLQANEGSCLQFDFHYFEEFSHDMRLCFHSRNNLKYIPK